MDSNEFIWRVIQQMLVTTDAEGQNICAYGSGFFLEYNQNFYFITAEHVLVCEEDGHKILNYGQIMQCAGGVMHDGQLCGRYLPCHDYFLIGNFDNELFSACIEGGEQIDLPEFVDTNDVAIMPAELSEILSLMTVGETSPNTLYKANLNKIPVEEKFINYNQPQKKCLFIGIVNRTPVGEYMINDRYVQRIEELEYTGVDAFGNYILKTKMSYDHTSLAGLSGSPVFDYDYKLIGMLIRENSLEDGSFIVVPIKTIVEKIKLLH